MREYGFELSLCASLEAERNAVVSRQLGTAVDGRRVMDVVLVEPGPGFDDRAAITAETIPPTAIESDVGPGRAVYWKDAFDCHPEQARGAIERAVELGFFERERTTGRTCVRATTRYPGDWYGRLVGIENKPDLGRPGDLERQLQKDVSLGLLDAVVLATSSYVTGAHLNRIPEAVGVWRFDPDTGDREVVREPTPLDPEAPGVDIVERHRARTEIAVVPPAEIARVRRRVAERAYGKGWRPSAMPGCAHVDHDDRVGTDGLPACGWKDRLVAPGAECGPDCEGFVPAAPPAYDAAVERDRRQPWRADPEGTARRQAGLDRFSG